MLAIIYLFLCPIFSPIYLYCSPVILVLYVTSPLKWEVLHATKPGSTHNFYIRMPCTKSGKWPLLYYSSFLCVLHFNVVFLLCRSSLILDAFPSVLVCNPDLVFLYRFMNFEQRYTTVAFIEAKSLLTNDKCRIASIEVTSLLRLIINVSLPQLKLHHC